MRLVIIGFDDEFFFWRSIEDTRGYLDWYIFSESLYDIALEDRQSFCIFFSYCGDTLASLLTIWSIDIIVEIWTEEWVILEKSTTRTRSDVDMEAKENTNSYHNNSDILQYAREDLE